MRQTSSGRPAAIAQVAQRDRPIALGQPLAAAVGDQVVMVVARRAQAEQRLQQAVDVGGVEQVLAAGDQRHALQMVVDRDRQMVARRHVLARQHDVAEAHRIGRDRCRRGTSSQVSGPVRASAFADVEAQRVGLAVLDPPRRLGRVELAADAGIERLAGGPVRGPAGLLDLEPDLAARAEAGIDHARAGAARRASAR